MERSRGVSGKSPRPTAVVFDLGEVLATPTGLMARLAGLAGLAAGEVAAFESAYWCFRDTHDCGSGASEYWGSVLRAVAATPSDGLAAALSRADAEAWSRIRPDAETVLAEVAEGGFLTAILSNAPRELGAAARRSAWATHVGRWYFSGELGMSKPDPHLFAYVSADLGVASAQILFLDDRSINVQAARAAGWNAWQWTSAADIWAVLNEHDVLGPS